MRTGSSSSTPVGSWRRAPTTSSCRPEAPTRASTTAGSATRGPSPPARLRAAMSDVVDQLRARAAAALPPTEGELVLPGLGAPVEVLFDRWGVPSVRAGSLEDLWLAQGYLSAAERLFQIELALRASNGRLSEVFADATLQDDRFARTVGFHRAGATYAASWSPEARAMVERFVEGARAWVDRLEVPPVEYALLDRSPELPH